MLLKTVRLIFPPKYPFWFETKN